MLSYQAIVRVCRVAQRISGAVGQCKCAPNFRGKQILPRSDPTSCDRQSGTRNEAARPDSAPRFPTEAVSRSSQNLVQIEAAARRRDKQCRANLTAAL